MCGIAGLVTWEGDLGAVSRAFSSDALSSMAYRGPDSAGEVALPNALLLHRRLAVLDLSPAGSQPMSDEQGSTWVVLNGEIYNHRKLRAELENEGFKFRSRTDTEVLVHGFNRWGTEGLVERLRGMFAIGIWDSRKRELFLVRDRLGVKPLYYCVKGPFLAFCSVLPVLARFADAASGSLDASCIDHYLAFGFTPPDRTPWRSVEKVGPAEVIRASASGIVRHRYWTLPRPGECTSIGGLQQEVLERLDDAVQVRLESDVPLGIFLSGGIDSGLVAALAARRGCDLTAFTVDFENTDGLERRLAEQTAAFLGVKHRVLPGSEGDPGLLERVLHQLGEPLADSSVAPMAAIARAAKQHATVALTGDGGDDTFCGYARHAALRKGDLLRPLALPLFTRFLWARFQHDHAGGRFHRLVNALHYALDEPTELYSVTMASFRPRRRELLYQDHGLGQRVVEETRERAGDLFRRWTGMSRLDAFLRVELSHRLPGRYLTKVDVGSSAFAVECRSPFLDHELVELATSVPARVMLPGTRQKGFLRAVALPFLPPEVAEARKRGFAAEPGTWLAGPFGRLLDALWPFKIGSPDGILQDAALERLRAETGQGLPWRADEMWSLLCLEVWWRVCVLRQPLGLEGALACR